MDFLNLPVEIGSKIFDYLDIKSKINVYNSCNELKEYFAIWCKIKHVVLSRSTLATVKTLEEKLFYDLGEQITELNLSGVPDLTALNLKPHIPRFVRLKYLDVTYTDIYLGDITEICPPNLKRIGINFFKCINNYNYDRITQESEAVFIDRQIEAVHFIVLELSLSASPFKFLKDVNSIKDLKLTITDNYREFLSISNNEENGSEGANLIDINFDKLNFIARDCAVSHKLSKYLTGITHLNFKQLEFIFLMYLERIEIYVSPLFAKLFAVPCSCLKVEVTTSLPLSFMLDGNIVFKAWNKQTCSFDEPFFENLKEELKDYLPTYFCMHRNYCMKIADVPSTWFCIDKCVNIEKVPNLPDKVTLTDFCRCDGAIIESRYPIGISKTSNALQNLTYLGINNISIRSMFFRVLFQQCPKLVTLNVYVENPGIVQTYMQSLSQAMHLAKLKNFYLCSEDVQYEIIFKILSRCSTLENVHVCEYEREINNEDVELGNILRFLQKSVNLYSLFIEADMSAEGLTMMMGPLKTMVQRLGRNYLYIEVCQSHCGWNPFADVFSPSPLHIFNN